MKKYQVGERVDDCPVCSSETFKSEVIYKGGREAICTKCKVIFEVDFEEGESPAEKEKVTPIPNSGEYAQPNSPVRIPEKPLSEMQFDELNLPSHIKASRPWRFAHELKQSGNPYRHNTKSFEVFDAIDKKPGVKFFELFPMLEAKIGDKLSYVLTIYEVVTQCVASGLLLIDKDRSLTVCKVNPKPTAQV